MTYDNPFSDDPAGQEPPRSNTAVVIAIVLGVIGCALLLMCGGLIVGGLWLSQRTQSDFRVVFEEPEFDNRAFRTDADLSRYYRLRGAARFDQALVELESVLAEHPQDPVLHNEKAWLLATCSVDEVRDGALAVEHGTKACELSEWSRPEFIDTLAAAHAEAGDFEAAVKYQQDAIELNSSPRYRSEFQRRLELYEAESPFRQE